jgi:hypothetical protein
MGTEWKKLKLSYKVAMRHWEKVGRKGELRLEREQAWNEAHSNAHKRGVEVGSAASNTTCPVCVSMMIPLEPFHQAPVVDGLAWWERPGGLVSDAAPKTSLRSKRAIAKVQVHGSPTMRGVIREHRATRALEKVDKEQVDRRYRTEVAVRRKHQLDQDTQFDADFWDSPISGLITRQSHNSLKELQRMADRRARGNIPRPRPPRSLLSYCESAGELGEDGEAVEDIKAAEEAQEREWWERKARQVGTEVGYLYFSGTVDGLEDWRKEYLRSDHSLIWWDRHQREGAMEIDG